MNTSHYKQPVILGAFIFLGLLLFILAVFTIGTRQKVFTRTLRVRVVFDDVEGLQAGNNVWLSGLKIGTVKKLGFYRDNRVEVLLDIVRDARQHIHKDARAMISSDGLIGNRIVVLEGGTFAAGAISEEDTLAGGKTVKTADMLATLQQNNHNLLEITGHFKEISKKISEGKGAVGVLLNDAVLAENLRRTAIHLRKASGNSEQLTGTVNTFTDGLNQQGGLAHELLYDTITFRNLRETMAELKETSVRLSSFMEKMQTAGEQLNKVNTPAGMLLQDEEVAKDLKTTIGHLRSGSEKLDEDLEALQHNFLFRGFFKKKAKAVNDLKNAR